MPKREVLKQAPSTGNVFVTSDWPMLTQQPRHSSWASISPRSQLCRLVSSGDILSSASCVSWWPWGTQRSRSFENWPGWSRMAGQAPSALRRQRRSPTSCGSRADRQDISGRGTRFAHRMTGRSSTAPVLQ